VTTLIDQIEDPDCSLPKSACAVFSVLATTLKSREENIAVVDVEICRRSRQDALARTLRGADHRYGNCGTRPACRDVRNEP